MSKSRKKIRSSRPLFAPANKNPRDIRAQPDITSCPESKIRLLDSPAARSESRNLLNRSAKTYIALAERASVVAQALRCRGDSKAPSAVASYFCFYATERRIANVFLRPARKSASTGGDQQRENTRARARGSPIDLVRARRSFRRKTLERVKRKGKLPFASLPELSRSLHACMCALQPAERERNRKFISRNHPTSNSPLKITLHFALLVSHSRASPLALYSVSHFACNALVTHHVLDVAPA